MRIHLLCDQKWRDLPNLAAIKLELERLGHRVLLSATKDAVPMIKAFRPDCVVLNHLYGQRHREIAAALREAGVAVVLLPTEGMTHSKSLSILAGDNTDFRLADLLLLWNSKVAEMVRERWDLTEEVTPAIGCTRFDFYDDPLRGTVTPREEFCRQYQFDPARPIVTWASQYVWAHLARESPERDKYLDAARDFDLKKFFAQQGTNADEVPRIHADAQHAALDAVLKLAKVIPQAQFVFRPHPAEDRRVYEAAIDRERLTNVRFCAQDYIWNVLNSSDVHLHRHCTTAVEAWNWEKPTVEMAMNSRYSPWPDREAGSDIAEDADALIEIVSRYVDGASIDAARLQHRRDYIDRWYGDDRGARCVRAAKEIDALLRRRGQRRTVSTPLRGISASPREVVAAVARYTFGLRPNQSFRRRQTQREIDPKDKQITRHDVKQYGALVASSRARDGLRPSKASA